MTLCDSTRYLHYLSPTEGGWQHEKKLADEYSLYLPAGSVLRQDLGLLGHAPAGVAVEMPHKKPPKRELTFSQRLYNHLLSPLRVVIEHVHSGYQALADGSGHAALMRGMATRYSHGRGLWAA